MTKEAKLSAAMRIVPEWKEYDNEVKGLQARVRRGLYQSSDHEQVLYLKYILLFYLTIFTSIGGSRSHIFNLYISITINNNQCNNVK